MCIRDSAQGGRFGGWSLYLKDSVPTYAYNWVDHELYVVQGLSLIHI